MQRDVQREVVHVQDGSGQWSLCGVQLPDECPTHYTPQEELVNCDQCDELEWGYEGTILTGYYPVIKRKQR
jgi:hypothetical protein